MSQTDTARGTRHIARENRNVRAGHMSTAGRRSITGRKRSAKKQCAVAVANSVPIQPETRRGDADNALVQ
jgi:Holliday junction resolvasome RuvABC endonuclease subunit